MHYSKYLIIFIVVFSSVKIAAQAPSLKDVDITGLWKGTMYNDTTKQFYKYEIGISKEKGKLSGFSHTFFIGDDKEFYGVKKLKIKITDNKLIVEDDGLIANNYPVAPDKGVRQLNVLTLEIKDSIMTLSGPFETNRTRVFSSLTGKINLQRKNDFWQSALVPHLQELGRSNDLSFVKEDEIKKQEIKNATIAKEIASNKSATNKTVSKNNAAEKELTRTSAKETVLKEKKPTEAKPLKNTPENKVTIVKEIIPAKPIPPAAEVATRKNIIQQTVYYSSDSLQLSLYDNGEVDGDTVSVLMNGKIIMAKEGLSTNAVRKTIYTGQETDSVELVMYAENLGTIPPNTGLLVVHDGKNIYEIRFSGDLQKNASIILRRKKQ